MVILSAPVTLVVRFTRLNKSNKGISTIRPVDRLGKEAVAVGVYGRWMIGNKQRK